jgi:hypothetical protein
VKCVDSCILDIHTHGRGFQERNELTPMFFFVSLDGVANNTNPTVKGMRHAVLKFSAHVLRGGHRPFVRGSPSFFSTALNVYVTRTYAEERRSKDHQINLEKFN